MLLSEYNGCHGEYLSLAKVVTSLLIDDYHGQRTIWILSQYQRTEQISIRSVSLDCCFIQHEFCAAAVATLWW